MLKWLTLFGMVFVYGCQAPMYAGSQCLLEPGAMAAMQTYAWKNEEPIDLEDGTGFVSPIVLAQLRAAIENELAFKGFRLVSGSEERADMELAVTLRARRELVSYETGGQVCADTACWEKVNRNAGMRVETRTVGFLASDVYIDGSAVWRGWVETSLYRGDRDEPSEVMSRAIPKLFETFPP